MNQSSTLELDMKISQCLIHIHICIFTYSSIHTQLMIPPSFSLWICTENGGLIGYIKSDADYANQVVELGLVSWNQP